MDCIKISNMGFYAYHGTTKAEREVGQRFYLDARLECDLRKAATSDSVKDTVDYVEVYNVIVHNTCKRKYHLLEALAQDIARGLLEQFRALERVTISVRKPQVPLSGILDHVEVTITRTQDDLTS